VKQIFDLETLIAYANGTLDTEARQAIDQAVLADRTLAAELALVQGVRRLHADRVQNAAPGDFGWARLSRAIEDQNVDTKAAAPLLNRRFAGWQVAACAMVAVAAWQLFAVPLLSSNESPDMAYVPAAETVVEVNRVRVIFADETTEKELRKVIRQVNGEIVAGPSAIGFYTLEFSDALAQKNALEKLSAEPVVERVQTD